VPFHPPAREAPNVSLPAFSRQAELFSTAGLSASRFAPTDRYRLFAQIVFPVLASPWGSG